MTMATSVTTFILLFCAVANMSIGAYVFSRNPRSPTHRAFFLYAALIAAWALALALFEGTRPPNAWHT
jgi:surface polysaccharide O-acyltransferase-like enzyme